MTFELEDLRATIHEGYDVLRANTSLDLHRLISKLEDSHFLMLEHSAELAYAADGLRALLPKESLRVVKK